MATLSEALAIAVEHHQAGRWPLAEEIYRRILAVEPDLAVAWNLLGVVAQQTGRHEEAVECLRRAIGLQDDDATFHSNLGEAYRALGRLAEAIACYRRALELRPDLAGVHYNLGNALKGQRLFAEAIASYGRALELEPGHAEAHNNLGNVLRELGQLTEAVASFRRALECAPNFAEAYSNLGTALRDLGQTDEGVACFQRALQLKPEHAGMHCNLGTGLAAQGRMPEAAACYQRALALAPEMVEAHFGLGFAWLKLGRPSDAVASFQRAIELKPDSAEAYNNLGNAFKDRGELERAIECFEQALKLEPGHAETHNSLGNVRKDQGELSEAVALYHRAVELRPEYSEAHSNLAGALTGQGMLDEAIASHRRAVQLKPDSAVAHSNLLATMHYRDGCTLAELARAHAEYDRRHAAPLLGSARPHDNRRDADRRLRLGFVSPDLCCHPVGYFLVRALENLERGQFETICYSSRPDKDDLTVRLEAAACAWRDVHGWSDERLAEQVRADRVDILVDLSGHTADNRLLVFARKPAPIQATWIGYVGTTGLAAMDFLIADRWEVPEAFQTHYREKVLRLADGYVCYDPPDYAPAVGPLPALAQGHVTLASFNNPAKVNPSVVAAWAEILRRLPTARLVLKYRGYDDPTTRRRFEELFAGHGVEPRRIDFLGLTPHVELFDAYNRADLGLDPFPYCGGLTTCEALWMGVPVVTCPGETFASRHSLSHLSNVGLTETIAGDRQAYVELAVSLASDLPRLAALRGGLRQRMAASPLCDGRRFAADLANVLRDAWQAWCQAAR